MEPPASPSSLPPPLCDPSPPAESTALESMQPKVSDLGRPKSPFKWSEDRFSDDVEQDEPVESCNKAPLLQEIEEEKASILINEQVLERHETTLDATQNRAASPAADPSSGEDAIEQRVASTLADALSEESDLSDPPDDSSSEESDDSDLDYEDESDSSSAINEDGQVQQTNSTSVNKEKIQKPRRKIATNAREYVARLHEEEDRKYAKKLKRNADKKAGENRPRKRKLSGNDAEPRKTLKTANGSVLSIFNDGSSTSDGSSLLPMEPIKATTHAEQFAQLKVAQLKAQIPKNCDTRRTNTQSRDLQEAVRLFGYKRVEAENGRWKIKGMETALDGHQITAAAWMVKRELARQKPFGGLLADAPGMGKTVMSLACIVGNQADEEHKTNFCNATLVVVQNKAFGRQWEEEARRHCKGPVKDHVLIYDPSSPDLMDKCQRAFIVITTYSEIMDQYPNKRVLAELKEKYEGDEISYRRELEAHVGLMFKINWYRVILDEAHAIKNVKSRTCIACCALLGKYRWALSGTPLANSSDEMYPYLKFTQCESTWNSKEFKAVYTSCGKSNSQFEALTSLIMYRRTMNDTFLGHKIVNLPEKKELDLVIPLSTEEQIIVDAVKAFYKKQAAKLKKGKLRKGELEAAIDNSDNLEEAQDEEKGPNGAKTAKSSSQSMSSRLGQASQVRKRQAISHAFCIERLLRNSFEPEDLRELMEALEEVSGKKTILEQLCANMGEDCDISRYEVGLRLLQEREEIMFGKHFDMKTLLRLTMGESALRVTACLLCQNTPDDAVYADNCGHIFCSKCLCRATKGARRGENKTNCPHENCGKELEVGDDIETLQTKMESKDKSYREPGRDSNNGMIRLEDDRNGFFICSTLLENASTVPSTRLTATMAIALTWLHEAPDDKILIFTQFTGTAKILGYMLDTLGIGFVYYYGGLPVGQRRKALEAIKERADVKVMVATLKSGGQCLNLTVANRVIVIDPWWNKSAEQQAFGRVTRIGQEKVTHLVTIRTEEETDSHIHNLQLKKAADIDYTLQDDGHTPPDVSEIERQRDFFRKKSEQEERQKKRKTSATKKN